MQIPILWKRESWLQHRGKLSEEFTELCHELHEIENGGSNIDKVVAESLDVIQVAIGHIDKAASEYGIDAKAAIMSHTDKLISRGWSIKGWIDIGLTMGMRDDSVSTLQETTG